jgi:hypothetical protein
MNETMFETMYVCDNNENVHRFALLGGLWLLLLEDWSSDQCVLNANTINPFPCSHCFIIQNTSVCRSLRDTVHTVWMDNYNKLKAFQAPSLNKSSWAACAWSCVALKSVPSYKPLPTDTLDIRTSPDSGLVIPAMPDDPFTARDFLLNKLRRNSDKMCLHDTSLAKLWKVDSVPLKPALNNVPEKYQAPLEHQVDAIKNFHPLEIVGSNIGSNDGFCRIVRKVWEDHKARDARLGKSTHLVLIADINIFDRLLKVLCFPSSALCFCT